MSESSPNHVRKQGGLLFFLYVLPHPHCRSSTGTDPHLQNGEEARSFDTAKDHFHRPRCLGEVLGCLGAPQLLPGRLASGRGEVGGYPENIQNHCHHCSRHLRTHKLPPPPGTRICLFLPNGGEFLGNRQITVS